MIDNTLTLEKFTSHMQSLVNGQILSPISFSEFLTGYVCNINDGLF